MSSPLHSTPPEQRWIEIDLPPATGGMQFPGMPDSAFAGSATGQLWSEGFGDPAAPLVLLVMGAMNQGVVWPDAFCREIASAGFCVVRYDHRDTGQSVSLPYALQPYTISALAADALAVARAWSPHRPVHWVGMSMGGVIAQMAALDGALTPHTPGTAAAQVASLTLMMTTPDLSVPTHAITGAAPSPASPLPPPLPAYLDHLAQSSRSLPHSAAAHVSLHVDGWRAANGTAPGFDAHTTRALVERVIARARQPLNAFNHVAATRSAHDLTAALAQVRTPTLVVHGAHDPLLPPEHGASLARAIAGATLLEVPHMGHMFDQRHLGFVTPRVIMHMQGAMRAALAPPHLSSSSEFLS